ncbi:MAG: carbohydrate binding family 9 domain-containing protein [Chitinophagaceae bacterium]|nr:carbohydrate binding family 9 domain-containing protein [Chitinophagaceae bacterium]
MLLLVCLSVQAQTSKTNPPKVTEKAPPRLLPAKRTTLEIKIDGLLNDSAWKDAPIATDFIEFRPAVGVKEQEESKTVSYLLYSDEGIYFGGFCYERTRDSIAMELKGRDGFGMNDFIGIIFDTYKDNLNGFEYFVTPLNEQWDAKMAPNNNGNSEDFSWNAVWKSGVVLHDNGWSFEIFIPYGAIRFGKKEVQDWGVNITRRRQKTGQQFTWNPIDPNVNGFLTQEGFWTGITNIKPPVRLQFSPYFSLYANHFPLDLAGSKNLTGQVNGGLDVKYGLNQAFTLDATLIPDFGQVQSDNQVLNLTPFEVQFNEYRNFFTEGTELFSKGGLFYSRRIGGTPIHFGQASSQVGANEKLLKNPAESKLINASKVSGRTQSGLGIGILNAVTKTQYATIEDVNTNDQRKFVTDPLTNYNIIVLDQTMKNNSSVSFINTNVIRSGSDYDANVTAALFDLNDKKNTWNVGGKFAVSQLMGYLPDGKNQNGYSHQLYFGKTSGRFNFNVWQELTDTKYTHRDLGYFTNNNFLDHGFWAGYKWIEPKSWYNRIFLNLNGRVSKLHTPFTGITETYQTGNLNFNAELQTKKLWWIGSFLGYTSKQNDFYEPRKGGVFFTRNQSFAMGGWVNSNEAKKYSFWSELFARRHFNFYDQFGVDANIGQTFRFNSKFSVSHRLSYLPRFNNMGFAAVSNNESIFARRKVNTVENILNVKYSFTNMMWITYRMRHYASSVDIKEYFTLQQNGKLLANNSFTGNANQNVNFFNIDMVYTWQFAPGSFLNVVWKNSIYTFDRAIQRDYFKNFGNTIDADANNNLSLKVIYFLDYLDMKKWGKKKK